MRADRTSKTLDIQKRFIAHMKASEQCKRWSAKCIELMEAGKKRQAEGARKKAAEFMAEMIRLEGKV